MCSLMCIPLKPLTPEAVKYFSLSSQYQKSQALKIDQRSMYGVKVLHFQIHNAILMFLRTHEIKNKTQFNNEKLIH